MAKITLKKAAHRFAKDQRGAAMIEYGVLIGLITAVTVGTIVLVGTWVNGKWVLLETALT